MTAQRRRMRSNSELERKAGAINALLVRPIGVLPRPDPPFALKGLEPSTCNSPFKIASLHTVNGRKL